MRITDKEWEAPKDAVAWYLETHKEEIVAKSRRFKEAGKDVWWVLRKTDVGNALHCLVVTSERFSDGFIIDVQDLLEDDSPDYFTVPKNFLSAAPVTNPDWRDRVDAFQRREKAIADKGVVKLAPHARVGSRDVGGVLADVVSGRPLVVKPKTGDFAGMAIRVTDDMVVAT